MADIYDQAVYALQAWEREVAQESAVRAFAVHRDTVASGMKCLLYTQQDLVTLPRLF